MMGDQLSSCLVVDEDASGVVESDLCTTRQVSLHIEYFMFLLRLSSFCRVFNEVNANRVDVIKWNMTSSCRCPNEMI